MTIIKLKLKLQSQGIKSNTANPTETAQTLQPQPQAALKWLFIGISFAI